MLRSEFVDCGSGLPHGQHSLGAEDGGTLLCKGKRKSDYVHCGEPGSHPRHRIGEGVPGYSAGPYCLGIMSAEEKAAAGILPIIYLIPFELASLLTGDSIVSTDSNGNEVVLAKHTPETLLDAHAKAARSIGMEPTMTHEKATELTRGL